MAELKRISLENVSKSDVAVCPKCGVLFVKSVKGEKWGLFTPRGIYCPVCDTLVSR
jgi:hypothetical protein